MVYKKVIKKLAGMERATQKDVLKIMQKNPDHQGKPLSKSGILHAYEKLKKEKAIKLTKKQELNFYKNIRKKKTRTISGVTPVAVLTKPFPCPGTCMYCPNDVRMPKSYLAKEPGAQRAAANNFDPYFQTYNRLVALRNIGHPTDKAELIILGGTWSHYPENYQIWFVKRCFEAMNDFGSGKTPETLKVTAKYPLKKELLEEIRGVSLKKTYNQVVTRSLAAKVLETQGETASLQELFKVQKINEITKTRCVGLVVETRPDEITEEEAIRIRKLGGTKVQIGIQSLDDQVLKLNKRGHDSNKTREAINLLRQAGFKIHAHWMPNLYGSNPKKDLEDFNKLFSDESIRPDELKIYPCSLIESAELMRFYQEGKWKPYTDEELLGLLKKVMMSVPRYCRITRVIRDISSNDIVNGIKKTNFRQIVEKSLEKEGKRTVDIRAREIRGRKVIFEDLELKITKYKTKVSEEYFIEYITKDDRIAGFIRLSLPLEDGFIDELKGSAVIRDVHVYGQSVELGMIQKGKAQHIGLGRNLIQKSEEIAKGNGFNKIAVISSIGTREYYKNNGFSKVKKGDLYQHKKIRHQ